MNNIEKHSMNDIISIFDKDSFQEFSKDFVSDNTANSSIITASAYLESRLIYLCIFNADNKSSVDKKMAFKISRHMELAAKSGRAFVLFYNSKGTDISGGLDLISAYSELFDKSFKLRKTVPFISIMQTPAYGSDAMLLSNSDFVINFGSKDELALRAGFSDDEASSFSSLYAKDTKELGLVLKRLFEFLPENSASYPELVDDIAEKSSSLEAKLEKTKLVNAKDVIEHLADSNPLYLSENFDKEMLTAFIHISGIPVAVIANNRKSKEDKLITSCEFKKAYRFLERLEYKNIPILSIIDCDGFSSENQRDSRDLLGISSDYLRKYKAIQNPKISLVLNRAAGSAYISQGAYSSSDMNFAMDFSEITLLSNTSIEEFKKDKNYDKTSKIFLSSSQKHELIDMELEIENLKTVLVRAFDQLLSKSTQSSFFEK